MDEVLTVQAIPDYKTIFSKADELNESYLRNAPFPHCVIDDIFGLDSLEQVLADFPGPDARRNWRRIHRRAFDQDMQFNKLGLAEEMAWPDSIRRFIWELNSPPFLHFLKRLTGIPGLLPDPMIRGGGLHQVLPGGLLGVHADFTQHRVFGFDRRVNLLLFLNKDWQDDFGGHLELWSPDLGRCEKRLRPGFGRCVIFNTGSDSFHGHPDPLDCPQDMTRKSIALYYYTTGRDDRDGKTVDRVFQTDWQQLPHSNKPALQ